MAKQLFLYGVPRAEVQRHIDEKFEEGYEVQQLDYDNTVNISILFRQSFDIAVREDQ